MSEPLNLSKMLAAMRPPTRLERLWYRWLRTTPPLTTSPLPRSQAWIRLLPQSWTHIHRWYAARHGLFWLPCILCGRHSGGHQWGGSIPDPTRGPGATVGICPHCTRAGRGWIARHPIEDVLDALADQHEHGHNDWDTSCVRCVAHDLAIREAITNYRKEHP